LFKKFTVDALCRSYKDGFMETQMTIEGETKYLTVAQLAKRLQISESTIYGWVDRDYIPFLMAGDLLRFDPIAVDTWMSAEADRKRQRKHTLHVRMVK
jgi:excisionase family DNA binding protein